MKIQKNKKRFEKATQWGEAAETRKELGRAFSDHFRDGVPGTSDGASQVQVSLGWLTLLFVWLAGCLGV